MLSTGSRGVQFEFNSIVDRPQSLYCVTIALQKIFTAGQITVGPEVCEGLHLIREVSFLFSLHFVPHSESPKYNCAREPVIAVYEVKKHGELSNSKADRSKSRSKWYLWQLGKQKTVTLDLGVRCTKPGFSLHGKTFKVRFTWSNWTPLDPVR